MRLAEPLSKLFARVAGGATLALLLAGCGPQSVADGTMSFDTLAHVDLQPNGGYPALWQEPDRLIVVVGGSSSCETVVTKVEEIDQTVLLTVERGGGPTCTADMKLVPTYFILENGRPNEVVVKDGSAEFPLAVVDLGQTG
jgi:hypothetical protein